jgi:hypothetical protein
MRIAHVFYSPTENKKLSQIVHQYRPHWTLTGIPESQVGSLLAIVDLLKSVYDAILLHMSMPFGLAVKMAELSHRTKAKTPHLILYSRTKADPSAIQMLFDGRINPDQDLPDVCGLIEEYVASERVHLDDSRLKEQALKIVNSSGSIKAEFTKALRRRHQEGEFTIDEYNCVVDMSIPDDLSGSVAAYDLFISHSSKDAKIAGEIGMLLSARGLSFFMAEHRIEVGAKWQDRIRDGLLTSRELLIILTPNSANSSWVMAEVGAGWALGKTTNVCSLFVDLSQTMELITATQVRDIATQADKDALASELAARLKGVPVTEA